MKANYPQFSFRYVSLVSLFLMCTVDAQTTSTNESNRCDINSYLKNLNKAWTLKPWPGNISSSCMRTILLQWAHELNGALDGETTINKNTYLDGAPSTLKAKCRPSLSRRTNRSTIDSLVDVFNLLSKLIKMLKTPVNLCSPIVTNYHRHYLDQTLALVRKTNCLVRGQNKLG